MPDVEKAKEVVYEGLPVSVLLKRYSYRTRYLIF